jgi:4-hydroxybenzoate polyprenyltransferase
LLIDYVRLCRPHQYLKNAFVLVGVMFGGDGSISLVARALVAFVAFSAIASAVYIGNDILDAEADRRHPVKCQRPIASGAVAVGAAWRLAGALAAVALALSLLTSPLAALLVTAYALVNVGYSLRWKHVVIVDVFLISSGFMLRLLVGTLGLGIAPSTWLLLCGFMLTLFLGFAKRRSEMLTLEALEGDRRGKSPTRRVLDDYSPVMIEQFMSVTAACTVISYSLYTVAPETIARQHTQKLILTVPFVVYGIFRYLYLLHRERRGADAARDLLTDTHMLFVCAGWAALTVLVRL